MSYKRVSFSQDAKKEDGSSSNAFKYYLLIGGYFGQTECDVERMGFLNKNGGRYRAHTIKINSKKIKRITCKEDILRVNNSCLEDLRYAVDQVNTINELFDTLKKQEPIMYGSKLEVFDKEESELRIQWETPHLNLSTAKKRKTKVSILPFGSREYGALALKLVHKPSFDKFVAMLVEAVKFAEKI
jgi:hypothetical protein